MTSRSRLPRGRWSGSARRRAQIAFPLSSRIATSEIPGDVGALAQEIGTTSTSNSPRRSVRMISTRPWCRRRRGCSARAPDVLVHVVGLVSAIFLVSVVTSTRSLAFTDALADLLEQVVDLVARAAHPGSAGHESRRPDHLLDHDAAAILQLAGRPAWTGHRSTGILRTPRSSAGGCRAPTASMKPYSDSVDFRERSPRYMPPTCGIVDVALVDDSSEVLRGSRCSKVDGGEPARVRRGGASSSRCRCRSPVEDLQVEVGALLEARLRAACPPQFEDAPQPLLPDRADGVVEAVARDVVARRQ